MRKKHLTAFLLGMTMMVASLGMTACGDTADTATTDTAVVETESDTDTNVHTVTFYDSDGETVLSTEEVNHGESATYYEPEKDGYTFVGWFVTPKLSREYDFSGSITSDTELFAGFVSYVEDTRSFAIVGSGESEVLTESNWGAVISDAQTMTKEEVDGANVYTLTVTLAEGDEFQFAADSNWSDQRGYGYLETGSLDGVDYLKSAGGLGETSAEKSNIQVQVAGTYTFTLTTYPAEDVYDTENEYYTEETKENFNSNPYDTITWEYSAE